MSNNLTSPNQWRTRGGGDRPIMIKIVSSKTLDHDQDRYSSRTLDHDQDS